MRTSRFQLSVHRVPKSGRPAGFSLLEVLIAIAILVVGLSALAALVAKMSMGTDTSHQTSIATVLASEKLEDLSRYPASADQVTAGGSLATDTSVTTASGDLDYFDDITLSNLGGEVTESVASTSGGSTTYTNVIHSATGYVDTGATNAPVTDTGGNIFHRRWLIESDPVVNGITLSGMRRVTVLVTQTNASANSGSFQMSLLRP
jgi:prepilin-type N-terminal cleavage/methylation domain-containing protein